MSNTLEETLRHTEMVAMNIVHQTGDALYEALPKDIAHEYFVDARQATNDVAIDFATKLILSEAHRIGMEAIGDDGVVHGHMRPQGYPSVDLTELYQNHLRKEQRQHLSKLTGIEQ